MAWAARFGFWLEERSDSLYISCIFSIKFWREWSRFILAILRWEFKDIEPVFLAGVIVHWAGSEDRLGLTSADSWLFFLIHAVYLIFVLKGWSWAIVSGLLALKQPNLISLPCEIRISNSVVQNILKIGVLRFFGWCQDVWILFSFSGRRS